jgi:hypothetical protein
MDPTGAILVNVIATNSNVYMNTIKKKKSLVMFCDELGFTETRHKSCFISTQKFQFPWPVLPHSHYSLYVGVQRPARCLPQSKV